jgi:hypothetical protein
MDKTLVFLYHTYVFVMYGHVYINMDGGWAYITSNAGTHGHVTG